jgi:ATP-dependent DNA helicase RecQ
MNDASRPGGAGLHDLLRRYWGYETFRPYQERIITSILDGHDVAAVMPTGGGKSLCYQLPAVAQEKTAVVVSPLIALMQDQVAQLRQMGIPAAALNSSMPFAEQRLALDQARQGRVRLLYLSPERMAREDTLGWLREVPLSFFAIDEAHCISEWGHEFRPEYRQLGRLRDEFPEQPIAAFTASATRRVRHDILAQLKLRDTHAYIRSFFRSNLRYWLRQCDARTQRGLLLDAAGFYRGEVIVYASTIAAVESTVRLLGGQGVPAVAYHGQMEPKERKRNQELWMSGEARVMVGTVAFGMGINKASVRAVIHLSLPKSIEQYYQEAGRAGRDGEPADCLLLWQKRDAGLLAHFIEQITDRQERERSWQRYHAIRRFAEQERCRHREMCVYFGEAPKWTRCEACDVCGFEPEWVADRKIAAPAAEMTAVLAVDRPKPQRVAPVASECVDKELFAWLRQWRRQTAQRAEVPAFVILPDTALADLCRKRPHSITELLGVFGIGDYKAKNYGAAILEAITQFENGARAKAD